MIFNLSIYIIFALSIFTGVARSANIPCSNSIGQSRCQNGTGCHVEDMCGGDYSHVNGEVSSLPHRRSKRQGSCIVPAHPAHGIYEVMNLPNAQAGQRFDSLVLTVRCRRGFGSSSQGIYCINGNWLESLPKCTRYCKLEPHPSVRFTCRGSDGIIECGEYVAPGTSVSPSCNSPIYYSPDSLATMHCVRGSWDYIARCNAECGRITPESWALVIGGKTAKRGELPWHVAIYQKTGTSYKLICGGSLISNNVVISAAHCFWSDVEKQLPASGYAVAIGKLYGPWDNERDFDAQKSDVKAIKIPRLFQGEQANFQQDIAVVILASPFTYKPHIRPVCLHFDKEFNRLQLQHGKLGKVAGWGIATADGNPAQILQVAELPYINEDVCIKTLPASFREYITGDKFCAGYTNGTALCHGDSGGGLAFPAKELGIDRFYLRGIVSTSPMVDEKPCNDATYTAFTKIADHEEFIKESIVASLEKICPHYLFQCADGTCVDQGADCNGILDCTDGSDESAELCQPPTSSNNTWTQGSQAKTCPQFQCDDGSCVDRSAKCNGITECPDGSDETAELCTSPGSTTMASTSNYKCVLPPFPKHGTYVVINSPFAKPGQTFSSWSLIVSCGQGYGAGAGVKVNCQDGRWNREMPQCTQLSKPSKITAYFRNETTLEILWQPPSPPGSFTHYRLSIDPPDAIESVLYIPKESDPPGQAQARFTDLVPGRKYVISVQTVMELQSSAPSIGEYRTIPEMPTNVTLVPEELTPTSFKMTWLPPTYGEFDKYLVTLSGPTTLRQTIKASDSDTPSAKFSGLYPGSIYFIDIQTLSGDVSSKPSSGSLVLQPLPVMDFESNFGDKFVDYVISWSPSENSTQDVYKVWYYLEDSPNDRGVMITTSKTKLTLTPLKPGTTYDVVIIAVSHEVESEPRFFKVYTWPGDDIEQSTTTSTTESAESIINKLLKKPSLK